MIYRLGCVLISCLTSVAAQTAGEQPSDVHPSVPAARSESLQDTISQEALLEHATTLETIAYATPQRNRLAGSPGHQGTVDYISKKLSSLETPYYNVTLQQFPITIQTSGSAEFLAAGVDQYAVVADFSPNASFIAPMALVNNVGCNLTDYTDYVRDRIALIKRGNCTFAIKSALAGKAGALGAVIYNNVPGNITLTLSAAPIPEGPPIATLGINLANGTALADTLRAGNIVEGDFTVQTVILNTTTHNVIAETLTGSNDSVLMLGAHSDSVKAGPGINDNGSGVAAILESALQLAKSAIQPSNKVRFAFWSGEEEGLVGSSWYVDHLSDPELDKIRAYLNFDMIASPNYRLATFDGDGSSFNRSAPPGSAGIEAWFKKYFRSEGLNITETELNGRSDYGPFMEAGIAVGGLATGAEGVKTPLEAQMFGGVVGRAYDENYHGVGDNVTNLALDAFYVNAKAVAAAVEALSQSFGSLSLNGTRVHKKKPGKRRVKRHVHDENGNERDVHDH